MNIDRMEPKAWLPFVVLDKNGLNLYTKDGEQISGNIMLRVTDDVNGMPEFFAKGMCNIAGSVDEMKGMIEKLKAKEAV